MTRVVNRFAKRLSVKDCHWRNKQPAWELKCDKLKLILTKHGLNIASVSLLDDPNEINPFWIPPWPWSNPDKIEHMNLKPELAEIYGNREDSKLLANICGHNICIDRFGFCNEGDEPRGIHGEAPVSRWNIDSLSNDYVSFISMLPIAQLMIKRTFTFDDDRVYVTTDLQDTTPKYKIFFDNLNNITSKNNNINPQLIQLIKDETIKERQKLAGNTVIDQSFDASLRDFTNKTNLKNITNEKLNKKNKSMIKKFYQRHKRDTIDQLNNFNIINTIIESKIQETTKSNTKLKKKKNINL